MRDVAALAGVSAKTVSRVVNSEPKVSGEVRARVNSAIARLNYRHNLAASRLRSGTTSAAAIGVLLVDIGNPFSASLHRCIEDLARMRGLVVLAASTDEDPERERNAVTAFTIRRVDGILMMPASHDQSYLLPEIAAGTKIVMMDRPPAFLDVDAVVSDNLGGADVATTHLIKNGHVRVAFLGDRADITSGHDRFEGYCQALKRANIEVDSTLIRQGFLDTADIEDSVVRLLRGTNPPTAFLLGQNLICAPTVRALRKLRLEHTVAVVGFDGFEAADLIEPGLTVVKQDPIAIARRAVEILSERLNGRDDATHLEVLPTTLIPRGSGELPGPLSCGSGTVE